MKWDVRQFIDDQFAPDSRVWIYQSSRLFTIPEALAIEELLVNFIGKWKSHGTPVKGAGYLFFGQFVILMADERATGISGCSTDSSVRLVKQIEEQFSVNMFDRTTLAFLINDQLQLLPLNQLQYAFDNGFITGDTRYFNNLVATKEELEKNWLTPVRESWLAKRITMAT
jgi:hypothetical protein